MIAETQFLNVTTMLSVTISNDLGEKTAFGKNMLGSVNAEYKI